MHIRFAKSVLLGFSLAASQVTWAQLSEKQSREAMMFTPVPLNHFGTSAEKLNRLDALSMQDLVSCRDVLISFFKTLATSDQNIEPFVTSDLAKKLKETGVTDPESYLVVVGITDFDYSVIGNSRVVKLNFFLLSDMEGEFVTIEKTATLTKKDGTWLISSFGNPRRGSRDHLQQLQ